MHRYTRYESYHSERTAISQTTTPNISSNSVCTFVTKVIKLRPVYPFNESADHPLGLILRGFFLYRFSFLLPNTTTLSSVFISVFKTLSVASAQVHQLPHIYVSHIVVASTPQTVPEMCRISFDCVSKQFREHAKFDYATVCNVAAVLCPSVAHDLSLKRDVGASFLSDLSGEFQNLSTMILDVPRMAFRS